MARCGGAVPQWTANGAAAVVDGSNLGRLRCASWIPFLLRDYLGLFQKRFDCLESQMTLLPWFGQHLIFQSRNACTRRPRRIPHPRQYLTQPHLLWSLSRTRVRLSRQPYSYFNSELLFPVLDLLHSRLRRLLAQSGLYGYQASYFWLIFGLVIVEAAGRLQMVSPPHHA